MFARYGFIGEENVVFGVGTDSRHIFFDEESRIGHGTFGDLDFAAIGHLVIGAIGQTAREAEFAFEPEKLLRNRFTTRRADDFLRTFIDEFFVVLVASTNDDKGDDADTCQ